MYPTVFPTVQRYPVVFLLFVRVHFQVSGRDLSRGQADTREGGAKHPRTRGGQESRQGGLGGESSSSSESRAEFSPFRGNSYLENVNITHVRPRGAGSQRQQSDDVVTDRKIGTRGGKKVRDCRLLTFFLSVSQTPGLHLSFVPCLIDFKSAVWHTFVHFFYHFNKCRRLA